MFRKRSDTSITLEKLENIYNELNQRAVHKKSCQQSKLIFRNRIKNDFTFKYPVKNHQQLDTNPKSKWNTENGSSWRKNQIIESKKIGNHFSKLNKKLGSPKQIAYMGKDKVENSIGDGRSMKHRKISIDLGNDYSMRISQNPSVGNENERKENFSPEEYSEKSSINQPTKKQLIKNMVGVCFWLD